MPENNTAKTYRRALTIAGSDSGGGAGIQADLKTFSALECYGMSVITALTAQNTRGVEGIHDVSIDFLQQQLDAVLDDIGVDAVKIGMLHTPEVIQTVAGRLEHYGIGSIVLDPVMVAKSGDKLLKDEAIRTLRDRLMPQAAVLTPNIPEAEVLLERSIPGAEDMEQAARDLLSRGPSAVVVKGGHVQGEQSADCLVWNENGQVERQWFETLRVDTVNTHGTGCTFSSAIAAGLAHGLSVQQTVEQAKRYMQRAIEAGAGYRIGGGHGPVHHFHRWWR